MADAGLGGHVVFIGMMGAGKTTVGRKVAHRLDRPFFDTDERLEQVSGRTVADWFEVSGQDAFRDVESDVLAVLLDSDEPSVIATGGGIVVRSENRARLKNPAVTVVWLRSEPAFLANRVSQKGNRPHRPLLETDPFEVLQRLDLERRAFYGEIADVIIDIEPVHRSMDKPKKKLAALVIDALTASDHDHDRTDQSTS